MIECSVVHCCVVLVDKYPGCINLQRKASSDLIFACLVLCTQFVPTNCNVPRAEENRHEMLNEM